MGGSFSLKRNFGVTFFSSISEKQGSSCLSEENRLNRGLICRDLCVHGQRLGDSFKTPRDSLLLNFTHEG